jgi:hypothetical protein
MRNPPEAAAAIRFPNCLARLTFCPLTSPESVAHGRHELKGPKQRQSEAPCARACVLPPRAPAPLRLQNGAEDSESYDAAHRMFS